MFLSKIPKKSNVATHVNKVLGSFPQEEPF